MFSVFSLKKFFVEKKGWIFVSDPKGFKNPSSIEINVQKVEAESWESYAAIFLILRLRILKVFELTIFLTIFIENTINMWYDTISDNKVGTTNIFVWL